MAGPFSIKLLAVARLSLPSQSAKPWALNITLNYISKQFHRIVTIKLPLTQHFAATECDKKTRFDRILRPSSLQINECLSNKQHKKISCL